MKFAQFSMPTSVVTGLGSLGFLPEALRRFGTPRVGVVADEGLVEIGVLTMVLEHIPNLDPVLISTFGPDPSVTSVEQSAIEMRRLGVNLIIGIGGGSALGAAKAIAIRLTNDDEIGAYEGADKVLILPAPMIAVPTTAGSGSEVSNALVLHQEGRETELVVRGRGCEPRIAILDGRVLRDLPERPMTYAALDALSHCWESLWAHGSSYFTDTLARAACRRIIDVLPTALAGIASGSNHSGDNDVALQGLLEASCAANMACGNAGLGLIHALSSSPQVALPHGQQNGILLPYVAEFNADTLQPEDRDLLEQVRDLYDQISFTATFPLDVDAEVFVRATRNHPFRANNRRSSSDDEIVGILAAAGAAIR